ncbi:PREDICTED: uncharacterized protein LOC109180725 [Ipomoea nil]|uniref:uncharacterized protein LOC109180725 n=1 Tax=Ipomoea nil TaxID=35883 RepID=UPI00090122E4|nr:PREDICTED: uncharacterized protein LOC109180725 [Ipomoea nil]
MVAEGLSALIHKHMRQGNLHGITVARGAPSISHLLFVDDCFLFFKANAQENLNMKLALDTYAAASGQKINLDKSTICFSANVVVLGRQDIVQILGVRERNTVGRYLGLPSLIGRRKKQILGFFKERILTKIRSWNSRFLSRAGREVLLKNVVQAIPSYAMMVFLLPVGLCKEMETLMNEYWWTGSVGKGKVIRWRSWGGLCAPKTTGGMGFRTLDEMNLTLLGKQAWHLITRPSSLVTKDLMKDGCRRAIGNGYDTVIGSMPWLPDDDDPYIQTEVPGAIASASVSSLLNEEGTSWDRYCVKDMFIERDAGLILKIPISVRKPPDSWVWHWNQGCNRR